MPVWIMWVNAVVLCPILISQIIVLAWVICAKLDLRAWRKGERLEAELREVRAERDDLQRQYDRKFKRLTIGG